MNARGYTLVELLVSMAVILILLMGVGGAIVSTLHVQAFHAGRAEMGRTASDVAERLREEARSATAVFIPSVDVLGDPNTGTSGAHEVDFLRRLSAGGDAYVAYRFDAATGDITRYEYTFASSTKTIVNADLAAGDVAAFSLVRQKASEAGMLVGESDPPEVSILYGAPELVGGNDVVVATIEPRQQEGTPFSSFIIHLVSRAAPTALAVLAPKGVPTPPPTTTVIPFVILRPGFKVRLPHGPMHGGSPSGPGSLIHWVAAAGSVQFFGASSEGAGSWFEFSAEYARLNSGVFTFKAADGTSIVASVSCVGGPCPAFKPLPVSAPGVEPIGGVVFQMAP
jgi:prepilin-type N-terminal cleavage/methylation domain-containing protein